MPHFGVYNPESFGWQVMHDIVPYSWRGISFPEGVARITVPLWDRILDAVVPTIPGGIHPGGPMVAGTWGAENRNVRGSSSKSFHSYGIALDLNAPWNPMFAGLPNPGQWVLSRNTGQIVHAFGAEWGGDWSGRKDSMHIELHISPDEVAHYAGGGLPLPGHPSIPTEPRPGEHPAAEHHNPQEEDEDMPMIVRRTPDGTDWAWRRDGSLLIRIPSEGHYNLLVAGGLIDVGHGKAEHCEQNLVDWVRGWVAMAGGHVLTPDQ